MGGACFIELFFIFSAIYENQFYYLFADLYCHGLFPALWRGLQMVVEVFCCFWRECSICSSLQCVLLCYKVGDRRVRPHSALLLLHGDHGRHLLVVDWHDRILCCLHVHPQDLWGSQDRLKALIEQRHVISTSYL